MSWYINIKDEETAWGRPSGAWVPGSEWGSRDSHMLFCTIWQIWQMYRKDSRFPRRHCWYKGDRWVWKDPRRRQLKIRWIQDASGFKEQGFCFYGQEGTTLPWRQVKVRGTDHSILSPYPTSVFASCFLFTSLTSSSRYLWFQGRFSQSTLFLLSDRG